MELSGVNPAGNRGGGTRPPKYRMGMVMRHVPPNMAGISLHKWPIYLIT